MSYPRTGKEPEQDELAHVWRNAFLNLARSASKDSASPSRHSLLKPCQGVQSSDRSPLFFVDRIGNSDSSSPSENSTTSCVPLATPSELPFPQPSHTSPPARAAPDVNKPTRLSQFELHRSGFPSFRASRFHNSAKPDPGTFGEPIRPTQVTRATSLLRSHQRAWPSLSTVHRTSSKTMCPTDNHSADDSPLSGYTPLEELISAPVRYNLEGYMDAPWFCANGVLCVAEILKGYVDGNGFLPGNVPFAAIKTRDWLRHIAIPHEAKKRGFHEGYASMRRRFMRAVLDRFSVTPSLLPIPTGFGFDTWYFRTIGEREYGENLASLASMDRSAAEAIDDRWHGVRGVRQEAIFWLSPILPTAFRTTKRYHQPFFRKTVRLERKMRSSTGFLIPYHMREAEQIAPQHLARRFVAVPSYFPQIEVCQGFWSELGPIVTYLGSYLQYPQHGVWCVFLTEFAVKAAAFLLWEVFDTWRLWYLPRRLIKFMRQLDMSVPLGGQRFDKMLKELLDVIVATDWDQVPRHWSSRTINPTGTNLSPGRNAPNAGDYVYWHPKEWRLASMEEAKIGRVTPLVYDDDGPLAPHDGTPSSGHAPVMALEGDSDEEGNAQPNTVQNAPAQPNDLDQDMDDYVEEDEVTAGPSNNNGAGSANAQRSEADNTRALLRSLGFNDDELGIPFLELRELLQTALQNLRESRQSGVRKPHSRSSSM